MNRTRHAAIGMAAALALLVTPPAAAQSQTVEQIRAVCVRFSCTPAQFREVTAFYDANAARITDLARTNRVNQTAFQAIAIELGVRYRGTDPQAIVRAIEARIADAARYEQENVQLRQKIAAITDARVRAPAEAALARADAAYAAGDLDAAQAALADLVEIRSYDLESAISAADVASQSAISLAAARGDNATLEDIVVATAEFHDRQRQRSRIVDINNFMILGNSLFQSGIALGDNAALSRSIMIYRDRALSLVRENEEPLLWAQINSNIGNVLLVRGERSLNNNDIEEAIIVEEEALRVVSRHFNSFESSMFKNNLAKSLITLAERSGNQSHVWRAIFLLKQANMENTGERWAIIQTNLGQAYRLLGRLLNNNRHIERSNQIYSDILEYYSHNQYDYNRAVIIVKREENNVALANSSNSNSYLGSSLANLRQLESILNRSDNPLQWAELHFVRGLVLFELCNLSDNSACNILAIEEFRLALQEQSESADPVARARTVIYFSLAQELNSLDREEFLSVCNQTQVAAAQLRMIGNSDVAIQSAIDRLIIEYQRRNLVTPGQCYDNS